MAAATNTFAATQYRFETCAFSSQTHCRPRGDRVGTALSLELEGHDVGLLNPGNDCGAKVSFSDEAGMILEFRASAEFASHIANGHSCPAVANV